MSVILLTLALLSADARPADTAVVCPKAFVSALEPLLAHRHAHGHRFVYISNEHPAEKIRDLIRQAARGGHLRAVLLVGDHEPSAVTDAALRLRSVPTHFTAAKVNIKFGSEPEIAGDNWYADLDDDDLPDLAIGRLPADNPAQLAVMVKKILAYDQADQGDWRQRINLVAGVGGFGPILDPVVELAAKKLITEGIPPAYTTSMTFGSWRSPYCPDPRRFHETTVQRLNEGCLFWVYIGHGQPRGLDRVAMPTGKYHIFTDSDCDKLNAAHGSPIAVMLACYTAAFDGAQDCLAEQMLVAPGGPVAVYGGSRVTMPYGMAVMGTEILDEYFRGKTATLGEVILNAKRRMAAPASEKNVKTANRLLLDGLAKVFSPAAGQLEDERREHLALFNLLGDPNLRLTRPQEITFAPLAKAQAGKELEVLCRCPIGGRCTAEIVSRRDTLKSKRPIRDHFDPSDASLAAFQPAYLEANDSVWSREVSDFAVGSAADTPLLLTLPVPLDACEPAYVRVYVEGREGHAMGAVSLTILAKQEAGKESSPTPATSANENGISPISRRSSQR